ncbi:MAG: hypothetical protein GTN75_00110 [Gemmatimonadetes bacterium]|nr:hypothetical protein [Gemmatimonadota bacterium]
MIQDPDPRVRAWYSPYADRVEVFVQGSTGHDRRLSHVATLGWTEAPEPGTRVEPTFAMRREDAQVLMDGLWDCGLRPVQGAGSAGAMDAVKYHLEDMRRLVFGKKEDV